MPIINIDIKDIVTDLSKQYPELKITIQEEEGYNRITLLNDAGASMFFHPELVNKTQQQYNFTMFQTEQDYISYLKEEIQKFFYSDDYQY